MEPTGPRRGKMLPQGYPEGTWRLCSFAPIRGKVGNALFSPHARDRQGMLGNQGQREGWRIQGLLLYET